MDPCDSFPQRFRVDRRKLELMMMNSPEFGEVTASPLPSFNRLSPNSTTLQVAAEFFERIGAETNTCVIWPSRYRVVFLTGPP